MVEMISGPISHFPIYFYISYFSLFEKLSRSHEIPWSEVPLYMNNGGERRIVTTTMTENPTTMDENEKRLEQTNMGRATMLISK